MLPAPAVAPPARDLLGRYIRPLAGREIRGLVWSGADLIVLDTRTGRLALVDPDTDDTRVLNDGRCGQFLGARGLAQTDGSLWFTTGAGLLRSAWSDGHLGAPEVVVPIEGATAVAAWDDRLYLVRGPLLQVRAIGEPGRVLAEVELPGIGGKGISATADALWLTDDLEQTVYCLDRGTLEVRFMAVTPLEGPTAIVASAAPDGGADVLHVAYYEREPYLKDDPWSDLAWAVRHRDRALVHQLHVHHEPAARCAWSTGHRIQMHYYVEVEPDADVGELTDVIWRMSLPIDSPRQRLVDVEPIGLPFEVVTESDREGRAQPVAVFRIPRVDTGTRLVLGWRATLEVFGIKHLLTSADLAQAPELPAALAVGYLVDDEDLDLDSPQIVAATAAGLAGLAEDHTTLDAARALRSYVYDRLDYEMGNQDSPIDVLARGTGSCGEHVGVIMALFRQAGLACRVAGRYKCPYQPWSAAPLYPDFNHVWVDLYLPGYGWVPVESNPDGDVVAVSPYPDRFLLGLPWRHVEVGKDISFENVTHATGDTAAGGATGGSQGGTGRRRRRIGARRLSRNHIRFDVLAEIAPGPVPSA